IGAEHLHTDLSRQTRQIRSSDLAHRSSWTWALAGAPRGRRAESANTLDLLVRIELREPLADDSIRVALQFPGDIDSRGGWRGHAESLTLASPPATGNVAGAQVEHCQLLSRVRTGHSAAEALIHQRGEGHRPATVQLTHDPLMADTSISK